MHVIQQYTKITEKAQLVTRGQKDIVGLHINNAVHVIQHKITIHCTTKGDCRTTYQKCCPCYTTIHRTTEKTQLHQITSNVTPAPALANAKLKNIQKPMMTMKRSRFTKKICLVRLHIGVKVPPSVV